MMKQLSAAGSRLSAKIALLLLCPVVASAALATPAGISSITVSGGVATITTSAAHNLAANNPGFCIVGSTQSADNICGSAASVVDSTHFTVNSATMVSCSSSCGTSQPAPLFVLRGQQPSFGVVTASGCMWTFVANGIPSPNAVSACSSLLPANIQSEVNGAIASGQWLEQSINRPYAGNVTLPTIDNDLLALQLAYQNAQQAASAPGGIAGKQCDVTGCN